MKTFLIRWLLFLLPLLMMAFGVEYFLRQMPNNYKTKAEGFKRAADFEILSLGSSHAFYGIDPSRFGLDAINAAQPSQTYDIDLAVFDHYNQDFTNLRYLLIPVSYFSFQLTFDHVADPWRAKNYRLYYNTNVSNNPMYSTEITSLPLKKNIERLRDYYRRGISEVTVDSRGLLINTSIEKETVDLDAVGSIAAERHMKSMNAIDSTACREAIEQLIAKAAEKNITVILFTTPCYKSYTSRLDDTNISKMKKTAEELAGRYNHVEYHDFLFDSDFTADDFRDADHLNRRGSAKLTARLDEIIQEKENY